MLKTTRYLNISPKIISGLSANTASLLCVQRSLYLWHILIGLAFVSASVAHASIHRTEHFLQRLSSAEGLSHNRVFKTLQDNNGYIWIATETGLNRYDGYQVQHIPGPNNVFNREYISTLFLDNDGFLWIPTYSSGIYRMDPNSFETQHFQQRSNVEGSPVFTGISDAIHYRKNEIWLAGDNRIVKVNPESGRLIPFFTLQSDEGYVRTMLLLDNMLYIGTSQGLYRLDIGTREQQKIDFLPAEVSNRDFANHVKKLFYEPGIGLVIGTVKGLYQLSDAKLSQPRVTTIKASVLNEEFNIWDIDKVGSRYYLSTNEGLYTYNFSNSHLSFVLNFSHSRYYTNDNNILDLYVDRNHTLWMSSRTQGVLRWSENVTRFQHLTESTKPSLSREFVEALYQDKDNVLWIGTKNGLNRYHTGTNTIKSYAADPDKKAVWGMQVFNFLFPDSEHEDRFWAVTDLGLFSFNKATEQFTQPNMTPEAAAIMQKQWIYNMHLHNNENVYFITESGHFHFNTVSGVITPLHRLNEQIPVTDSKAFLGFLPERPQEILIASSTHIYLYHLQNHTLQVIYAIQNTIPDLLFHVEPGKIDQNNVLWFTISGEGLVGLDAITFELKHQFSNLAELTNVQLHSLEIDQYNNIWVGSVNGLFRLDSNRIHAGHYVVADGLISRKFTRASSLTLNNNHLAFGTQLGLTMFNPADFTGENLLINKTDAIQQHQPYQVHLSEARILLENGETENSAIFKNNTIELDYGQPGLYLNYSTLDFQQQSRTSYQIDLQGPTQVQLTRYLSNELLLPRLEAGKYQLTIRAHHPIYGIDSRPLKVSINVAYWPWLSPMAKTLYGILLFVVALICATIRRNKAMEFKLLHRKLKESLNRMQMALESNSSGIWEYHCEKDLLYEERLSDDLGFKNIGYATPMATHISLINPEHAREFVQSWKAFINSEQNDWQFTYQMLTTEGKRLWYRDIGKVVERDMFGNVLRISGTYTNITERRASEERSSVFGKAFCQINDWVLILDNELRPVTANNALTDILNEHNQGNRSLLRQLITRLGVTKARRYRNIMLSLELHEYWQGEDTLSPHPCQGKAGSQAEFYLTDKLDTTNNTMGTPVSVKIHSIDSNTDKISHYVVILSDITAQKSVEQKLQYMANYDFLTELPNRKLLLEKMRTKIERHDGQFAVLFIDLDKFKQVNDLYGHYVGDNLLRCIAKVLVAKVGCCDLVARQSGDEFIIMLNSFESINDIALIAKSILDTLTRPIVLDDLHVNVTASIGVAIYPDDANEADALISKADLAMIHAKRQARGDYQFFTTDMNEEALAKMTLENDLKRAVIKNEFQNYYQPIVNSHTDTIVGAELLLRWNNAGKAISPGVFIPLCEEIGIISQMTINAIDRALHDYKKWFCGHRQFYISINLSPVHILQEGLQETLTRLLEKHHLSASVLRLEITESTLLSDVDIALRRLEELRALGFKLLLDDFGTGYSSMGYLSKFSIDYIKIDKSFVLNLNSQTNRSIISSVVTLADNLSLGCIVEGVETQEQREYMESLGCKLLQGYYYSKAVPAPDIVNQAIFKHAVH